MTRRLGFIIVCSPNSTSFTQDTVRTRLTLSVIALSFAIAACGGGEPQAEPEVGSTPAAAPSAHVENVVRTSDPAASGYADSEFPRVQELAPDVYSYEQLATFGADRVTTVSFFVVTTEGVLVADGGNSAFPSGTTFLAHPFSVDQLRARGGAPTTLEAVDDERTITMGGHQIRVMYLGRAHTGGDLVVYLPQERIMFLGKVLMNHMFPSRSESYPSEWIETIERAQAMDVAVFVPGHGFVDMPPILAEELETFQGAIRTVIDAVDGVHDEGAAVEEAIARANFGDAATWSRAESLREPAIRRVYADLNGELRAS